MEKETPDTEHGEATQMVPLKSMKTSMAIKDKKKKTARGKRKSESREEALI